MQGFVKLFDDDKTGDFLATKVYDPTSIREISECLMGKKYCLKV